MQVGKEGGRRSTSDVMNFDSIDACRSNLFKNLITGGDSKGFCKI